MKNKSLAQLLTMEVCNNSLARADLIRAIVKQVYEFTKCDKSEKRELDSTNELERKSLAKIIDATESHYDFMLGREII